MEFESELALQYLAESRNNLHKKRYEVVSRFIKVYGVLPPLDRIVLDLPEKEKIITNVTVPDDISQSVSDLESKLKNDKTNPILINQLDSLYDTAYRQR